MRPDQVEKFRQEFYERKYSPNQPRDNLGRWTDAGSSVGINDPRVLSDATPDPIRPGARYAQNRSRRESFGSVMINGLEVEPTPGQAARLTVAEAQAKDALARVREVDPNWKPSASEYESVEGLISAYQADARQAENRISQLQDVGIGPGKFAGESIPARGPDRDFTAAERDEINRIGSEFGCHTCGTQRPGTLLGNFVLDHQPPTGLNNSELAQRLYPQCLSCSLRQGGGSGT